MKKLSILCAFMFVVGMMASFALAQPCEIDGDCTAEPLLICLDGGCVECITSDDCEEDETCNDENVCVSVDPTVSVDIKPGSCPNPLNVRSRGVLPVAILGTDEFDVTTIDPETILITREGFEAVVPVAPIRYSYDDVGTPSEGDLCDCDDLEEEGLNGDGLTDLTLKFRVPEVVDGLSLKEVESRETIPLKIIGESVDGTPIMGEDCIRVINWMQKWQDKPKNPKKPKNRDEK